MYRNFKMLSFFILVSFSATAKNYYFSSSTGNDAYSSTQAQSQSTPWKSLSKLNSFFSSLVAGDVIYFKKGDVFYGSITATKSGSAGKPITFTSYGTGNRPVISGMTNVTSWTSLGKNIYQATVSAASTALNMVSINGIPRQMGRYPNLSYSGTDPYLYNETSGANYITDNQLTTSTNWKGATAVIRKKRWVMDRCKITNHSGGTLTFSTPSGSSYTTGLAGFGYFIQNDPRTLDQFGEWYLNPSTKALQVHFGGNQPSNYSVKVSTVDNVINLGSYKYITLIDIAVEGGNVAGLLAQNSSDITIQKCDFTQMGKDGILVRNSPNILLENLNVNYVMNNGINVADGSTNNAVVRSCSVKNVGMFPGMGGDGDGTYVGLAVTVNSTATVEYNNVDSIGHDAIQFQGGNINVRYNFVKNYCFVKDDGGGIYTVGMTTTNTYTNRNVYNNIVLNAIGCAFGSSGKTAEAEGIYMDRGTKNVNIYNNSVAHMARACFLSNNVNNVKINNNTAYDARWCVEFSRIAGDQQVRSIEFKKNIIYPKSEGQNTVYYKNFALNTPSAMTIQADIQAIGTIDSNYYGTFTPLGFGYNYSVSSGAAILSATFNLASWKSYIKKESSSKNPAKTPASTSDVRFEYNATASAQTIKLDANYVDVDNVSYNGSVTLQPYTSKLLIKNGASTTTPPPTSTLKAAATSPAISCNGGNINITIAGSGGTSPYSGAGTFSTNAGKGSLKLSFPTSTASKATTLYAAVGQISTGKYYTLRFTTIGGNNSGSAIVALRQFTSPNALLSATATKTFGTSKVQHQAIFTPTASNSNGRFEISIAQNSGTTYIDNIGFFESTSAGDLISSNLFTAGQFESNISGINVWSSNNNQTAVWDNTGKINSVNYYTVTDAKGSKSTIGIEVKQPATTLKATVTLGSSNKLTVSASGGGYPYTGTGTFTAKKGVNTFTVKDANGCSATASFTVATLAAARVATEAGTLTSDVATETAKSTELKISSYPNPSTTDFGLFIEGGSDEKVDITVMSTDGRVLYKTTGTSNKNYRFGNNFTPGLYIIRVVQGSTIQTLKVIKG